MKILEWIGEIGWEISLYSIQQDLLNANGEDITVRLSSPGGNISVGGDIYLALFNYRKANPNAKMILEIGSVAASYGSLLAASPVWDTVKASDISMAMYHNPANFAYGDYQVMENEAVFLKDARGMYVNIYSSRSGMSEKDTMSMMDKTTWIMGGQAIIDAGFADELISTDSDGLNMSMLSDQARMAYKNVMAKMSSEAQKNEQSFDYSVAMASMTAIKTTLKTETPGKPDEIKPSSEGKSTMEVPMNEEELAKFKKDNPKAYEAMMKEGADREKERNDERVKALTAMKQDDDYKDMPEILEVIDKAIMDGGTVETVTPKITIAVMKIMKDPARMAKIESPDDITPGDGNQPEESDKIGEV
jgi:ATP-dependent protease ClpP protease subunit